MWRLQDALSESHGSAVPPPPPLPSLETSILKENLASLEERVNTVRTDRRADRSERRRALCGVARLLLARAHEPARSAAHKLRVSRPPMLWPLTGRCRFRILTDLGGAWRRCSAAARRLTPRPCPRSAFGSALQSRRQIRHGARDLRHRPAGVAARWRLGAQLQKTLEKEVGLLQKQFEVQLAKVRSVHRAPRFSRLCAGHAVSARPLRRCCQEASLLLAPPPARLCCPVCARAAVQVAATQASGTAPSGSAGGKAGGGGGMDGMTASELSINLSTLKARLCPPCGRAKQIP